MKDLNDPEPPPLKGSYEHPPIWALVIIDMQNRNMLGELTYGVPLQAFNGRDALIDAYQEALDLAVYLRQEIEERIVVARNLTSNQPD